ncbi:MAG: hypothetical protein ACI8P3_002367 [Saprospiraceae bacterium]|jgi:hypothetical protein
MSKFALFSIFLTVTVSWIYQPFSMEAPDEMIDKYRPSLHRSPDLTPKDSVYPVKTHLKSHATAFHFVILS